MAVERLTPEKRREQTRSHLLHAAGEVFARRGYHGASLDEVAAEAGFSKGAVYSNFESKEDLFLALVNERSEQLVRQFGAAAEGHRTGAALIEALSSVYVGLGSEEREWVLWTEFSLYALRNPELRKKLVTDGRAGRELVIELVEQHCREAGVTPPLPAESIGTIYIALFRGLWEQRVLDPETVPDHLFASAVVFVRDAIETLGTKIP
jgi:AcrR family transcriptional regulator